MKYSLLNRAHPQAHLEDLEKHQDLFEGGVAFRVHVGKYLLQNEREPAAVFQQRCKRAHYLNYIARIVRWFGAALFASPPTLRSDQFAPEWYSAFKEDADGAGTDLDVVLREAFTRALVGGRAFVRVVAPEPGDLAPASLADADRAGLRNVRLAAVPTEQVRNWRRAPDGSFLWVLERERVEELEDITSEEPLVTETWTCWYADGTAKRWQTRYASRNRPSADASIPEIEAPWNPSGAIPLLELALPSELHLVGHMVDAQLEHFRKRNALSWAVDRTCYAMPWFFLKSAKKPPTMGTGFYGILAVDEKIEWPTPPSAPFEVIRTLTTELVQEIHRVVEQMALAVDNNAAAAVGRSGASKSADARATQMVLPAFGVRVREFCERIFDVVARMRGESLTWSVEGMDHYDAIDAASMIDSALASEPLRIPSATHRREVFKAIARAQLPLLSEELRVAINAEIEAGTNAEDTTAGE